MGQLWNREGDKQIAVCINSHHYGKIGDLSPLTEVKHHEKSWAYVSELVKSGNWRMTNEIEAGAYMAGHNSMLDAWEYIHPVRSGLWQQINDKNRYVYKPSPIPEP